MRGFSWLAGVLGTLLTIAFAIHRFTTGTFAVEWNVVGGLGLGLLALYLWLDRDELDEASQTPGFRNSSLAAALVVVALGITVAVNVAGQRYDKRWDWTSAGRHTLAAQSASVAQGLSSQVDVLGFFPTDSLEGAEFRDLVEAYQEHTSWVDFQLVDPIREPLLAEQLKITSSFGTIVLTHGEDQQRLEADFGEEAFTNALVKVTAGVDHVVCFTGGHGERGVDDDYGTDGLGTVVAKLQGQNYTVKAFVPIAEGGVPEPCEVVVVGDPELDLLPPEREMLAAYVAEGGALVVMLDPLHAPEFAADLARYGLRLGDDIVLEQNPAYNLVGGDASYLVLDKDSFDFHPVVSKLTGIVLLRVVRSVSLTEQLPGLNAMVLARSSTNGWAETDLETPDPALDGADLPGPVGVMGVVEVAEAGAIEVGSRVLGAGGDTPVPADLDVREAPPVTPAAGGRVVVFGDSDFVSNELVLQGSNLDLFLNSIAWLVGEE
ncbi:MAG: hypothetical protein GY884_29550, partial [Proteobacteria bacterium]|nr:hypothetical protein [Pseudomonadota bacterium]